MADDKKVEAPKFAPEVEKQLTEATSSDQIRDLVSAQPRDEKTGQFVSPAAATTEKKEEKKEGDPGAEPTVYKDTFLIGDKQVEFTGESAADILKQVKVAQQAYELGRPKPEVKKDDPKPAFTTEELAALQLRVSNGDVKAIEEYLTKSGTIDRYLESKGFKPEEYKQILEERATNKVVQEWDGAVKDFLAKSDWPGGTQNEKLLKYKLAELKDEAGKPLAYSPSTDNLMKAYEALKAENMLFPREEQKTEEEKKTASAATAATAPTTAPATAVNTTTTKRQPTGSTAFGTSQEQGTRRTSAAATKGVPQITDDMTPQQIMDAFKEASIAAGQSPDDALRATYAGRA